MNENTAIIIFNVFAFGAIGITCLCSERAVSWIINNTRAGQRWERWFGEERAIRIMRYVLVHLDGGHR